MYLLRPMTPCMTDLEYDSRVAVYRVRVRCPDCRRWIDVDDDLPDEDYQEVRIE